MSVDDFLAWAGHQAGSWELFDGLPNAMSPERVVHGDVKYRVARALDAAIIKAGLPCRFVLDSAAVRVDRHNLYQPDALVYCGDPVPDDALIIPNPIVVFEVLSPGNAVKDLRDKLQGYFRIPSIGHYLIVDPDKRIVIHHARGEGDVIATRILSSGTIVLEPPGITLAVGELFREV
jgi:Uma2 family endonuclease